MKYLFYIFFLTFYYSQSQTGKVEYSFLKNFDNSQPKKTVDVLFFNRSHSLYKAIIESNEEKKKTTTDYSFVDEHTTGKNIHQTYTNSIPSEYYFNLATKIFTCKETAFEKKKFIPYAYTDKYARKIHWELGNEFKNISGYRCQKATTDFRGRKYTAWFSPQIPLPYGPWKLNGLPGLILEAYDSTKEIYFTADKITIPFEVKDKINKPSGQKIGFKEFVEKINQEAEDVLKALKARLPEGTKIASTKIERNALELTYEWEKE